MALVTDERAQSIQIGAVLVFGILIIFLAIWQAFVVPNQNEEIEFDHNQAVQQELTELRGVVNSMPDAASARSTAVNLGVRYPSRAIFVNPGPTSGTLRTVGTTDESVNVTFDNVTAEGNVGDFWDDPGPYNTGFISYEPNYNLYSNAPETVFEHSLLYNDFGDSGAERNVLSLTGQSLVDGDRITVVTLNGSFSAGRSGAVSVDFLPVSTRTRTIDVEGDGGPVTLRIPTRLDNGTWESLLEADAELVEQGGNVERVDDGPGGTVELVLRELPADDSYDLRLAKVGLGTRVTPTDAAYLTDIDGDDTTVGTSEARDVTVEVRDAFNKPVRETLVNASAARGTLTASSPRSGSDGRVTFRYEAPESGGTDRLNFTIAEGVGSADVGGGFPAGTPENVTMTITVSERPERQAKEPQFEISWVPEEFGGGFGGGCDEQPCEIRRGETGSLALSSTPKTVAGFAEFSIRDRNVGTLSTYSGAFPEGARKLELTFNAGNETGETNLTVFAGGDRDTVRINVTEDRPTIEGGLVSDASSDGPPGPNKVDFTLETLDVTNPAGVTTFNITFDNQENTAFEEFDAATVDEIEGSNHSPGGGNGGFGDDYTITVRLKDGSGDVIDEVTIETTANGADVSFSG